MRKLCGLFQFVVSKKSFLETKKQTIHGKSSILRRQEVKDKIKVARRFIGICTLEDIITAWDVRRQCFSLSRLLNEGSVEAGVL